MQLYSATEAPSDWITTQARHIRSGGCVLDLACGSGRHARWLAAQGYKVDAIDKDAQAIAALQGITGINAYTADLENGDAYPLQQSYDGIVVTRYLFRPLLPKLATLLNDGGILIYETFMQGNARFGKPSNPDYLLQPDELLNIYADALEIIAFEQGEFLLPNPAMLQRICAKRGNGQINEMS